MSVDDPVYLNPLSQLTVVDGGLGRDPEAVLPELDFAEALDANHEDANGELPYRVTRQPLHEGGHVTRLEPNPDYQQPERTPMSNPTEGRTDDELGMSEGAWLPPGVDPGMVVTDLNAAQQRTRAQPTREQILARRQGLLDLLKDGPAAMPVMADAAGVSTKQLYDLLYTLRDEGLICKMDGTRPAVWALFDQAEELQTVDEPDAAAGYCGAPARHEKVAHGRCPECGHYGADCTGEPVDEPPHGEPVYEDEDLPGPPLADARGRYLTILAEQNPERLIALMETGLLHARALSPVILDTLETAIFGEVA